MPTSKTGSEGRLHLVTDVLRSFADATNDYGRLLRAIAEGVAAITELPCSIRLLNERGDQLETAAFHDPKGDPSLRSFASAPIRLTPDVKNALDAAAPYVDPIHTRQPAETAHGSGARAAVALREVLIAPLVARGKPLGALFVARLGSDERTFSPEDVDLVAALASHAALALANARLLQSLESLETVRNHERSILDTVASPLVLIDREGRLVDVNRAFLTTFDLTEAGTLGQSLFSAANGVFGTAKLRDLLDDLPPRHGVDADDVEVDLPTPTGLRTFVVRTKKTFRPGNGSQTTLLTLVDITDRKVAEQGARRRELIVSSMNEALIGCDVMFDIVEWNAAAERLFGWTAKEAIGRPIAEILEVTEGANRAATRRTLRSGTTVRSQMRAKNRAGEWVDVEYSTMPLLDGEVPTGFVSVMLDVTMRNRLDAELRARIEELTQVNAELESFSYSVSHDLRAPVRAIDGFSEIMEEGHATVLDEEGRRLLALIRKNAKRMGLLIDDLLALARFGRQPLVARRVDMEALVRSTLEEALRAEPTRVIKTSIGPLPAAYGDESLLRQVWINLFGNAVKYTRPRTEAVIETSARETDAEVIYTVKDNGAGFDARYADKLFGVFERLHSMKEFEGTGIGLALVARILKRHGGRVWGEGEVDRGATFHFALPKEPKRKEIS